MRTYLYGASSLNEHIMKHKKYVYSPELAYDVKWLAIMFLEDILRSLPDIKPPDRDGVTERVLIKVVQYCNNQERSLFFKFIKYINAHPYHLRDSVKKWSDNKVRYSRLLIKDSDEVGYVDITLLYITYKN